MKMISLRSRPDGLRLLHTWRTGQIYFNKNKAALLADWNNLIHRYHADFVGQDGIPVLDSRRGLPVSDASIDALYSCHVIEHLTLIESKRYLSELLRVLKPGGICRISTPDLEWHARHYVDRLDALDRDPSPANHVKRDLNHAGLIDQFCRVTGGGELQAQFLRPDHDVAYGKFMYGDVHRELGQGEVPEYPRPPRGSRWQRLRRTTPGELVHLLKLKYWRWRLGSPPAGDGEIERWSRDRFALAREFREVGFVEPKVHTFDSSDLPDWSRYQLDTAANGHQPIETSLYMEARRPAAG